MSFSSRFWTYLCERFPVAKTALMVALFASAAIVVGAASAELALRPFGFLSAFLIGMVLFFQMRVADEWKDLADDQRYRPERPVPRGLISLKELTIVAVLGSVIAIGLTALNAITLLWVLALVWAWLALMSVEFFVPNWLKAHPILYVLSHMLIMPLIALLMSGFAGAGLSTGISADVWLFMALSFANGLVLEFGRKIWAPENEREGVETYSKLWGGKDAAQIWKATVFLAGLCWAILGLYLSVHILALGAILILMGLCEIASRRFRLSPTAQAQKHIDQASGLWILMSYIILIVGVIVQ